MSDGAHCLGVEWVVKRHVMSQCGASSLTDETDSDNTTLGKQSRNSDYLHQRETNN